MEMVGSSLLGPCFIDYRARGDERKTRQGFTLEAEI